MKVPDIASLIRATLAPPSLPATNAKRLRKGAIATKQSILPSLHDGLLRFARNDGVVTYRPASYSAACCVGASSTSSTFGGDIGRA